jgi:hypothetical protein
MSHPQSIATPLPRSEWCLPAGLRPLAKPSADRREEQGARLVMERLAL